MDIKDTEQLINFAKTISDKYNVAAELQYEDHPLGMAPAQTGERLFYITTRWYEKAYVGSSYNDSAGKIMNRLKSYILQATLTNDEFAKILDFQLWVHENGEAVGYKCKQLASPEDYFNAAPLCGIFKIEDESPWLFVHQETSAPGDNPAPYLQRRTYHSLDELIQKETKRIERKRRIAGITPKEDIIEINETYIDVDGHEKDRQCVIHDGRLVITPE